MNGAIWALGVAEPFTFGIQPGTGRMFINDVGESSWEEINEVSQGKLWLPTCEGACSPTNPTPRSNLSVTRPFRGMRNSSGALSTIPPATQFHRNTLALISSRISAGG